MTDPPPSALGNRGGRLVPAGRGGPGRAGDRAAAPAPDVERAATARDRSPGTAPPVPRDARADQDPAAAGRLAVVLLPAQRLVHPAPNAYDLVLKDLGCVQVDVGTATTRVELAQAPRATTDVQLQVVGDLASFARLMAAGQGAPAPNPPPQPGQGRSQRADGAYLHVHDGAPSSVTDSAEHGTVASTISCPEKSLLAVLDGADAEDAVIRGDEHPPALLQSWVKRAQSG